MSDSDNETRTKKIKGKKRQIESDEESDEEYAKRRKNIRNYILDETAVDDDNEDNSYDDMLDYPDELAEAQDAIQYVKYDNRVRQSSLNLDDEDELERITTDMGNPSVYKFSQWFFNRQGDNSLKMNNSCAHGPHRRDDRLKA